MTGSSIRVTDAGRLTLIQDAGRPGWAHLGVPPSGAADLESYALANRIVGNPVGAAALECLLGNVTVEAAGSTAVAVTGAWAAVSVNGRPVGWGQPWPVTAADRIEVGMPTSGLRVYIAFSGGIDVPTQLGSRSTDVFSGLGPRPVVAGDVLSLGAHDPELAVREAVDTVSPAPPVDGLTLRVSPGPRADWFTTEARRVFSAAEYVVTADSNRVAVRLAGPELERARAGELASEGIVTGAVQVPSNGQPLVFLTDHPVTGGYPVIAVVDPADLGRLAQARPGGRLRFVADSGADRRI